MRILFIGGTGNLSAECAELLFQRGHEILVVSRGRSAVPPGYRTVLADRKDQAAMTSALKDLQPDVVINFLGFEVANVQTNYNLFGGSIKQYVFISSATVYAKPHVQLPLTEHAPLGNVYWDYAAKKLECERWLLEKQAQTGFPLTIVRPSHTYSKRWVPNPVSSSSFTFALRLEQGLPVFVPDQGETPWTLTAATDFAVGLCGLVGNAKAVGETFHITSDEVLSWNLIVTEIAAAMGSRHAEIVKVPTDFICLIAPSLSGGLRGDKAHPGVFDNSKIKRFVPEFVCRKPFAAGVRESVAWLRAHPEHQNLSQKVTTICDEVISSWRRRAG